jgi:hypothetical protein
MFVHFGKNVAVIDPSDSIATGPSDEAPVVVVSSFGSVVVG